MDESLLGELNAYVLCTARPYIKSEEDVQDFAEADSQDTVSAAD